jgi:hypothetical protein
MRAGLQEDERPVRFTKICRFPRAVPEIIGSHASFKVRKKTFACFLNDHHGDGIVGMLCKGDNAVLIKADPKRFYMPACASREGGWDFGWLLAE